MILAATRLHPHRRRRQALGCHHHHHHHYHHHHHHCTILKALHRCLVLVGLVVLVWSSVAIQLSSFSTTSSSFLEKDDRDHKSVLPIPQSITTTTTTTTTTKGTVKNHHHKSTQQQQQQQQQQHSSDGRNLFSQGNPNQTNKKTRGFWSFLEGGQPSSSSSLLDDKDDALWYGKARCALENSTLRYFVYNHALLTRRGYNHRLEHRRDRPSMRAKFQEDALVELGMIRALERHTLRTTNPRQADLFIVPLVVGATIMFDNDNAAAHVAKESFGFLSQSRWFRAHGGGHRHVVISLTQHAFDHWGVHNVAPHGYNHNLYRQLQNVTVARDLDYGAIHDLVVQQKKNKKKHHGGGADDDNDYRELLEGKKPVTQHSFSVGLGATHDIPYTKATYAKFQNSANFVFYHTRREPSAFNSTVYRHALVQQPSVLDRLPPSSIGFGIQDREEWLQQYTNSKFCLAVRGDTPHTHALVRSIKVGCIPVLVSDVYPDYAPTLPLTLDMRSFSIVIPERDFVQDPAEALLSALGRLSPETIRQKLAALRFAQQVALFDHPQSLFVPAFLKEAMTATQNPRPDLCPYYA